MDFLSLIGLLLKPFSKMGSEKVIQKFSEQKNISKSKNNKKNAYAKIEELRRVKTLLNKDKAVDIDSFYCPPRLTQGSFAPVQYQSINEFPSRISLIIGGAGQGKSIYLKQLCLRECSEKSVMPIFIELRRANALEKPSSYQGHDQTF